MILIFSRENAFSESVFSINIELLIENRFEELVLQNLGLMIS